MPYAAPVPERRLPAWVFSAAMHAGVILFLGLAIEQAPRGAAESPIRSAGIVLKRSTADGVLYEASDKSTGSVEAPDLLPADSQEPDPPEPAPNVKIIAQVAAPAAAKDGKKQSGTPRQNTGLRGASGNNSGDYAKVSVFGVQGTGNKFVYVFDRSSSMEGPPLAAAKRQLTESLKSLEPIHQFHIIFFNQRMKSLDITGGGRIAFATDRNKQLAANFIGGISADGGTDRFAALKQAFAFRPDVIFFLSDADDPMPPSELADIAKLHERFGTAICVIEFGRNAAPPENNFLKELARQSGGQYGYVNAAKLNR
jgi:hypothetical protein